jgi:hypothetical protein
MELVPARMEPAPVVFLPASVRKELPALEIKLAPARKESVLVEIQPAPDEKALAPLFQPAPVIEELPP